jgi:hypothetical protein
MQMHKLGDKNNPSYGVREYWTEAINAPGASQMKHLKNLILSKPFFERVPDQSLVEGNQGKKYDYLIATRGKDYAMIYTYNGSVMEISMGKVTGEEVEASWFNPRSGEFKSIGIFENNGIKKFDPPSQKEDGNDWVLVLETML